MVSINDKQDDFDDFNLPIHRTAIFGKKLSYAGASFYNITKELKNLGPQEYDQVVEIQPEKYFENTLNILQHLTRVEQANLGCKVNKTMWNTAPAVVNAYYSRNKNQIMVPAGILQPPFYHRYFPRSLNYGGIGVVIGHEITHGFDDKGRLFDKNGNLHRWWKDEAINNFHERARCLIEQYSKYTVQEVGLQIDGINTQGENIADNGGIKEAFRAYKHWLNKHGCEEETLPGLNATGMQLFFLNFAQVWCGNTRPEATRNKLKTAVHSPGKFRVIGTLTNSEDFSRVFRCPLGSPMNPRKKCSVW
ncbi:Membrane metallo-endopeptidase-like 1 [Homalodisca vitripennis]|nr:Membrane metallo-endopeptidase-like 1 [Homalodisca vitripennis]